MAQIVPFPLDKVRKSKNENIFEEKHILHMIKNIRQNYPPSLWNTVYQLTKQGHIDNDDVCNSVDANPKQWVLLNKFYFKQYKDLIIYKSNLMLLYNGNKL